MKDFLVDLLGADAVLDDPADLAPYREDQTEIEAVDPGLVAFATAVEQVQAIVREAGRTGTPLTARVAGTNIGGLTLASPGGLVLDLTRMDRILEVDSGDMYAVIEPGVTQQGLKDHLVAHDIPLTTGYALSPPYTSVFANALLGGLTNRSLKYGDQSQCISGLEVVLDDGTLARTGAWAIEGVPPFGRVPLPDLTGLYVAWQGTTGIATKMAFQLWPRHPLELRLFVLCQTAAGTFDAVQRLTRTELFDDIGGLSWPSAKMMMGVARPHVEPSEGEPRYFLYIDLTAEVPEEMALKRRALDRILSQVRAGGEHVEEPIPLPDLVRLNPALSPFAEFPTDLEFLTKPPGGGLSWIGTYGPVTRFAAASEAAGAIMAAHGFPPLVVSRPMRGGHYGVLRFITTFDKSDPAEVAAVRAVNAALLDELTDRGFAMYKTPIWAWERLRPRLDPGMLDLMRRVKQLMDPHGVFNPGKLGL